MPTVGDCCLAIDLVRCGHPISLYASLFSPTMLQLRFPQLPSFGFPGVGGIRLPKAQVHDVEERPEKRARTLKHLLKANHINHSVIYNHLRFHNHTPHILGSAYILGADHQELNHIYDAESKHLEPWQDSPAEISKHDWRDFLGKREWVYGLTREVERG